MGEGGVPSPLGKKLSIKNGVFDEFTPAPPEKNMPPMYTVTSTIHLTTGYNNRREKFSDFLASDQQQ
jgi:hypothetical protein